MGRSFNDRALSRLVQSERSPLACYGRPMVLEYWPLKDTTGLPTWDERIRALLPPSVDPTQLEEDLQRTPTQRLEKLQDLVDSVAAMRGLK